MHIPAPKPKIQWTLQPKIQWTLAPPNTTTLPGTTTIPKMTKMNNKNKTNPMRDSFSSDSQNYHCSPTQKSLSTKQQTALQLPVPPMLLPPAKPPAMYVVATPTTQTK